MSRVYLNMHCGLHGDVNLSCCIYYHHNIYFRCHLGLTCWFQIIALGHSFTELAKI
jgi:hypothetical protein